MSQKETPPPHDQDGPIPDPVEFGRNMVRIAAESQKLLGEFIEHSQDEPNAIPDPLNLGSAFREVLHYWANDPAKLLDAQFELWKAQANLAMVTWRRFLGEDVDPVIAPDRGDKRFRDPAWAESAVFDFIKQSYLLTANWMQETAAETQGLDANARRKVKFYTKQLADAISPTNFVLTNPEVLRATFNSNGENLVKGLDNLLHDLERGQGQLNISQTDMSKFKIGENIATTPGKVVFRNDLIELLQYIPTTPEVYERPLLIFPPWINKFYILDLKPENSFIKWATDQGYTVFVVSWVNPDPKLARKTFEDYMREGVIAALDAVEAATGVSEINTIGYCIGGTLLTASLAYLAETGDHRIKSATFFAAQADFTEAGDLQVFVDDHQLEALEQQMDAAGGVLEGSKMATTFNMLRANDLIWSFVINNYMLGKDPFPFDLLYWNADTTRMPRATHLFYLREFYRDNAFAEGKMELGGVKLDPKKIKVPVYIQSSKDDHIAPYVSVYKTTGLLGGKIKFMMAGSGHIAGVINPPAAQKYQYWTNDELPEAVEDWIAGATEHPGSWWPDWDKWLAPKSGKKIPHRHPGDGKLKVLGDAPGTYVLEKS